MGQAISQGIERFPALTQLMLWGRFADWDALLRLPRLRALEIRFTPDLQGLPPLDSWPLLDRFIAYNVDEAGGKRLKAQMKARGQQRAWTSHASVSQLRKPEWWQSEYGRPFSGWSGRQAKAANAAYDAARDALDGAADIKAAQAAITAFAAHFNQMKGIETSERDDIGEAVWQFSQRDSALRLGVTEEQAQRWLDAVRDYWGGNRASSGGWAAEAPRAGAVPRSGALTERMDIERAVADRRAHDPQFRIEPFGIVQALVREMRHGGLRDRLGLHEGGEIHAVQLVQRDPAEFHQAFLAHPEPQEGQRGGRDGASASAPDAAMDWSRLRSAGASAKSRSE